MLNFRKCQTLNKRWLIKLREHGVKEYNWVHGHGLGIYLTWGGEYTIECMDDVLYNYAPETCVILLTSVTTNKSNKKGKMKNKAYQVSSMFPEGKIMVVNLNSKKRNSKN